MRNDTRKQFNSYVTQLAKLNQTEPMRDAGDGVVLHTAVLPAVTQRMVVKMQESTRFLDMINVLLVDEVCGEKLQLDIPHTIAGRTDTRSGKRQPISPTQLQPRDYQCHQTNFDTCLSYDKLDAWAHLNNFQHKVRDAILKRKALDLIMIGWNGTHVAQNSDRNANPLLQDVNIGWLQHVRNNAPQQVMIEGSPGSGKIKVGGPHSHYQNLDALGHDLQSLFPAHVDPQFDLVALCSSATLSEKYFPIINERHSNVEALAAETLLAQPRTVGGISAFTVPFLPDGILVITPLSNLSIYIQERGIRRKVVDNPKKDQIENYESSNDAYVIEDYDLIVIAENIEFEGKQ